MPSVNDILTGPHKWAKQTGIGSLLDITAGRPAVLLACTIFANGGDPLDLFSTVVRFYDSRTASGRSITMRLDLAVAWTYTFDLAGGVRFRNGLSIDVESVAGAGAGGVAVYEVGP